MKIIIIMLIFATSITGYSLYSIQDKAMEKCLENHSQDVCFTTLN